MKIVSVLLILTLILTVFIQTSSIASQSMVIDEYIYFLSAQLSCSSLPFIYSIYEKHTWFYDHPLVGQYIYSLSCIIPELNFSRMLSIIFGAASIFILFLIGKKLYNEKIGLLSSFLYGLSMPVLAYFRLAIFDAFLSFFILLSVYFFLVGKEKQSWFFGGFAFGVKYAGIILVPIFLFWHIINKKFELKKALKNICIFALGFLLTNFAALLMWDYVSPNKGLFIKVPTILKTFLYQTYAQGVFNMSAFFNNMSSYMNIMYYQIGILSILIFIASSCFLLKKKDKNGVFLIFWSAVAFLFASRLPSMTRYLIPMLPAFFIVISYGIFEIYNMGKRARLLSISLAVILSLIMIYNIAAIHPYYLLFGYENGFENTGASLYGQYTKESIDFINENTAPSDKIYWNAFSWHPPSFKPSKYSIILKRNATENITEADYFMLDLEYKLKHPNNETVRYIEGLNLTKEFKIKNIALVWIYKK